MISAGARLGPYEVLSPLGAGGMGEVWRARDPRLGREVAIKVLPASFSADVDRLRCFEQEARAAGILNHPNRTKGDHITSRKTAWPLFAGLLAVRTAFGADPVPADKQAFLAQPDIYLSVEITEADTTEFGTGAKDALTDGAHRYTKTAKFEIPLTMPMPDTCPPGTTSTSEAMEKGRCIGWMAAPPDAAALEAQLTTGKIDLPTNPNYLPVEFSIDAVSQFRYRDTPAAGFATETTTSKGRGTAYVMRSGMLLCDVKKMACNLNNAFTGFVDGTDLVTVTKTSDVPGFEATKETVEPARLLPKVPLDMEKQFVGFAITLPEPITKIFKGPTVTVNLTLSPKPAPIPVPKVAVGR